MRGQTAETVENIPAQQGSPFPWQQPADYMLVHSV